MSLLASLNPDPSSVLLGGVVLLCLLWWLSTRRPPGLPPGPGLALPLLGHLHLLAKDPRPQFWAWRRQYGDVFSLYLGGKPVVVLASYAAIREALVTLADAFSDRPQNFIVDYVGKNQGIAFSSGSAWKEQRKTSLEILRAMGMGKNVLAQKIQEEITHYIRAIKNYQGAPVDLIQMTQVSISNNICAIAIGKRFDCQDPKFISHVQSVVHRLKLLTATDVSNHLPVSRYIPGDLFKIKEFMANDSTIMDFIGQHLAEHKKTLEEEKQTLDSTDFIYNYFHEIQKRKTRGDFDTSLNEKNLQRTVAELVIAGTDTTSTALLWALVFFLHYPHVQDKCFKEISDVIGSHRPPTMRDKVNLPYLAATICEALRCGDIVSLSLEHATAYDVIFRGYVIPKGTTVVPFLSTVLQDPDIWGDPENFRPERFIDPDGKLIRREELTPFSLGRRVCLGESMARMELFLYLATLLQRFHFLPPEEGQLPSLEGVFGVTYSPRPFKIRAVPRL